MNIITKGIIHNIDNYYPTFQESTTTIFIKYITILNEYFKHSIDNIYIPKILKNARF